MATVKVLLRKGTRYKDGTSPVMLKIRVNGKPTEEQLFRIDPKYWLASKSRVSATCPFSAEYNDIIETRLHSVKTTILDAVKTESALSTEKLLASRSRKLSFSQFFRDFVDEHYQRVNSRRRYLYDFGILERFAGGAIQFSQLTEEFFEDYVLWEQKQNKAPLTIAIRIDIFHKAIKLALKKRYIRRDPLMYFEMPRKKIRRKSKLLRSEIEAIENLDLPFNSTANKARCAFLLQYYLRGTRISDVLMLRKEAIVAGRFEFSSIKTNKFSSVLIHPRLEKLLETLLSYGTPYLIPLMTYEYDPEVSPLENEQQLWLHLEKHKRTVNYYLKKFSKMLGLGRTITSHVARHSFAKHADEVEPDKRKVQGLLTHSKFHSTEEYLGELRSDELDGSSAAVYE